MRQLIIARKDLKMSAGKLAAQVSHASLAYFTRWFDNNICYNEKGEILKANNEVFIDGKLPIDIYEQWFHGIFTKTICEAKNKNQLLKVIDRAKELGLKENEDFFLIKDACLTELQPEEVDENGAGRTLTCIGFKPLPDDVAHELSHKYHLYM